MTKPLAQAAADHGITRQRILGLSAVLGLTVAVKSISLEQLLQADELIICNSLFGAFQVTRINNKIWPLQSLAVKIRDIVTHD